MAFTSCSERKMTYHREPEEHIGPGTYENNAKANFFTKRCNSLVGFNSTQKRNLDECKKPTIPKNMELLQDIYDNTKFEQDNIVIKTVLNKAIPSSAFVSTSNRFGKKKCLSVRTHQDEVFPGKYYSDPVSSHVEQFKKYQNFRDSFRHMKKYKTAFLSAKQKIEFNKTGMSGSTTIGSGRQDNICTTMGNTCRQKTAPKYTFYSQREQRKSERSHKAEENNNSDIFHNVENETKDQPIPKSKQVTFHTAITDANAIQEEHQLQKNTTFGSDAYQPIDNEEIEDFENGPEVVQPDIKFGKNDRNAMILKTEDLGPGCYKVDHKQVDNHVRGPKLGVSKTQRFLTKLKDKDMKDIGPGKYDQRQEYVALYKYKPSAAFLSKEPKDSLGATLSRKIFGKKGHSCSALGRRKPGINHVNEILDFDENVDYRKIKPDLINGMNIGPGSYDHTRFGAIEDKRQGRNECFNVTSPRFLEDHKNNVKMGPGAYNQEQVNTQFKKAMHSFNNKVENIPFNSQKEKTGLEITSRVPGPGAYRTKSGLANNVVKKNSIHDMRNIAVRKNPRVYVPDDEFQSEEIGPGYYDNLHRNLTKGPEKISANFVSDIPRQEVFPNQDSKFGKYDIESYDIKALNDKLKRNVYSFNCGTGRFDNWLDVEKEKEMIEGESKNKGGEFKGLFDHKILKEKDKDMVFKYTASYGGGYRGGLMLKSDVEVQNAQSDVAFNAKCDRFEKTGSGKEHIGPGKYYNSQGFDNHSWNIKYL